MVFLSNENNVITTFIAPSNADSLSFSLVVTDDGGASDTSDISIIINMIHPENRLYVSNEGSDLMRGMFGILLKLFSMQLMFQLMGTQ